MVSPTLGLHKPHTEPRSELLLFILKLTLISFTETGEGHQLSSLGSGSMAGTVLSCPYRTPLLLPEWRMALLTVAAVDLTGSLSKQAGVPWPSQSGGREGGPAWCQRLCLRYCFRPSCSFRNGAGPFNLIFQTIFPTPCRVFHPKGDFSSFWWNKQYL